MRLFLRSVTLAAICYSVTLWILYTFPFWRYLPADLALPISANSCGSAFGYRQLYEGDPELRKRILPVTMAKRGHRGGESEVSQWSCDRMARAMRDGHAALDLIPQRFLCQSARRRVRELYRNAHHNIGPPLWVVNGQAVGPAGLYDALTEKGIAYTDTGLEIMATDDDINLGRVDDGR